MKKMLIPLILIIITGCSTPKTLRVAYSGHNFYLPPNPEMVISEYGINNLLIIKYGSNTNKNYIGITKESDLHTGNCDYKTFFNDVLNAIDNNLCDDKAVKLFRDIYLNGSVWRTSKYLYYYFTTSDNQSFVFFTNNDSELIKLDSDFLTVEDWQSMLLQVD
ncbi:hypothetical protein [Zooshikella sp. RANM57]|uniref:hypothetical protein n=1 Tax=Zooshikella sp. RANM57 TaxID=3425863 RepID=UPI003D6F9A95